MVAQPRSRPNLANRSPFKLRTFVGQFGALIFLIALWLIFAALKPDSWPTWNNFWNILRQASFVGIIAVGMTFVILTGGIDLSVGSIMALGGIVAAGIYKGGAGLLDSSAGQTSGVGLGGAILIACGVGLLCGAAQGLIIVGLRIQPFVVTLGGMSVFRGLTLIYGKGGPISAFDKEYQAIGQLKVFETVPVPVIIFFGLAIVAFIILRRTQYGRYIYAIGGNREAARLSGLNTRFLEFSVYALVGLLAGLAGLVLSARLNSSEAVAGLGYELPVIAAVVIGGTTLTGGEGGVFGTVVGALLITVITQGLTQLNVNTYIQQVIIGVGIVLAVLFDRFIKWWRRT